MAHIIAQHTINSNSGVPADAVVNVFHFGTPAPAPTAPELDAIQAAIAEFYDTLTPNGLRVCTLLAANALTVANARIKLYNAADPKPRTPIRDVTRNTPGFGTGGLPNEVALVLSFRALTPSGVPIRRRRGRLYLGPLSDQATLSEFAASDRRPTAAARLCLAEAATRLAQRPDTDWSVFSTVDNVTAPVLSGFVDNAYDTQRRRGRVATVRTVWP